MDYTKTIEILRILSKQGYSLWDLCCAIEKAAEDGAFPEVREKEKTLDEKIEDCLRELSVPNYLKGWDYLRLIIKLKVQDKKNKLNAIALYADVAKHFDTKPTAVERAIRVVMKRAFEEGISEEIKKKYFNTAHVTTKQFFMGIARKLEE